MPGLTLLNIDRERENVKDPLTNINILIEEIYVFIKKFPPESPAARLVPLKMKLRQLQDVVSQFGSDGTIDINHKQSTIMQLHTDLQQLTNNLVVYPGNYSDVVEICSNYLLNHLCSTAAVDPRATVIGVSNVMAAVLSKGIEIIDNPVMDDSRIDTRYFEEFANKYNHMLTIAGLFSAPVLGLPDIPISQLGSWADQALSQFAILSTFIDNYYKSLSFYKIEKELNARSFDIITDLLSFYFYLNEFFTALIARADLLSGIEFPAEFTKDKKRIILQSTTQINDILATSLEVNCKKIETLIAEIKAMYSNGGIDRNDNPNDDPELRDYETELVLWHMISRLAKLMPVFFNNQADTFSINPFKRENLRYKIRQDNDLPSISEYPKDIELELIDLISEFRVNLSLLFPRSDEVNEMNFIQSSDFTRFRHFLQYLIHIVAAHDIFLHSDLLWCSWLISNYGRFFLNKAIAYNPLSALEVGILTVILGLRDRAQYLVIDGISILKSTKKFLEFQLHNYLTIEVMTELVKIDFNREEIALTDIIKLLDTFIENYQISPNSLLHQRVSLYKGMLQIYQLNPMDEENPFSLMPPRYVSFDPFTWILLPSDFKPSFPYITLNSALANLSGG